MARATLTPTLVARTVAGGLLALSMLASPASAFAWGNGPGRSGNTFGTHDWILTEANRMAATQGATWVNASVALPVTDDPDTVFRDLRSHSYDRWGKPEGDADKMVATHYRQAVAFLAAGDIDSASRSLGLLSHYFADANYPINTDNLAAEKRMRTRYQAAVDERLNAIGKNSAWVSYDGYNHVNSASSLTISSARTAHGSYNSLVAQYNRRGYNNKTVRTITSRSINRATNGLADIIVSIQEDAALVGASRVVGAHQGVTSDGSADSDYWVFHTYWIQRYTPSWVSTATASEPFSDADGSIHDGFTEEAHLGTGAYYDGKLYVPAENWPSVTNQHLLVFDAKTLKRERAVATSQTHEVAAVTIAPDEAGVDALWVASYRDSSKLFKYDLATLSFVESMTLSPVPARGIQGLTYREGTFFISTGLNQNLGRIYTADRTGKTRLIFVSTLPGWHEGIAWRNNLLMWLVDHGTGDSRVRYIRLPGF
jgi:hypothetical protein